MKKRHWAGTLAVAAVTYYLAKMGFKMARDLERYDRLRAMSNEGPVLEETPDMLMQVMVQERHMLKNWAEFFKAIPKDVARDAKIFTM